MICFFQFDVFKYDINKFLIILKLYFIKYSCQKNDKIYNNIINLIFYKNDLNYIYKKIQKMKDNIE